MLRSWNAMLFGGGLLLWAVMAGAGQFGARTDSTTFVREFAKCDVKVYLITSGPKAAAIAKTLQDDIITNRDAKPNQRSPEKAPVLTLEEAEGEASRNPKFSEATRVFLLSANEMERPLPEKLAGLCPVDAEQIHSTSSEVVARNLNPKAGKLAFSIGITAPDEVRLRKILAVFTAKSFAGYRSMLAVYTDKFDTVRLAVFSDPKDRAAVENWGRTSDPKVWFASQWRPLGDYARLKAEDLRDCNQVFFIDRSQPETTVPPPAAQLLASHTLKDTSILIERGKAENGRQVAVFSAPNDLSLAMKANRFPRFEAIAAGPIIEDLTDLRKVGRTTLMVLGVSGQATPDDLELIRLKVAREMRTKLNIVVEERGPIWQQLQKEVVFQDLQGATNTAQRLRQKNGVRYIWVLRLLDYNGNTSYEPAEKMASGPPPSYGQLHPDDPEPPEPVLSIFDHGRGKTAKHEEEMAKWQPLHDRWLARVDAHKAYCEQRAPCQFERMVTRSCNGRVKGVLSLIDLENASVPVWEKEVDGQHAVTSVFATDRITVNGYGNRPASLQSPPTEDRCPTAILQEAAFQAGNRGISLLQETAWVSNKAVEDSPQELASGVTSGPNAPQVDKVQSPTAAPLGAKVADVDKGTVVLKIDPVAGVRVGDKATVALRIKTVNDPDDPTRILAQSVVEVLTLKIVTVKDNMAEAVAVTPQAKAGLGRVKVGMAVTCEHVPSAPAAPKRPALPTQHKGTKKG